MRGDGRRHRREVEFHAHMGLNCIRLWAGAGVATSEMLDACDELGVLVWYEFWVTGLPPDSPAAAQDLPILRLPKSPGS